MDAWAKPSGNLSPACRAKGLRHGVYILGFALAAAVTMRELGAPPLWRALLFLPFFMALVGMARGLIGICAFLALKGQRETDDGVEPVAAREERARLAITGRNALLWSSLIALALTAAFVSVG
ncbi:MAG: hypothetical protein R3B13_18255 [Polyangiaceae bacterium]